MVEALHLALLACVSVVYLVFLTAGSFSFGHVWFNQFSILTLITSIGIAVEFTVRPSLSLTLTNRGW